MSKINRVPVGLQSLLGNAAAGENPDQLQQAVSPIVDLEPYWDFEKIQYAEKDTAVAAPQNGTFFTVPTGELWLPISLGGTLGGMGTGDTASLTVKVWNSVGTNPIPIAASPIRTFATSLEFLSVGFVWPRRQVFRSGQLFSIVCDDFVSGAAKTLQSAIQYVRLKN